MKQHFLPPLIDTRERDLEVAKRRMWLPFTIILALLLWAGIWALVQLIITLSVAVAPFSP